MAESTIPKRSIIRLHKSKSVTIGTSATKVTFTYSIPSGYTLVCPTISHNYSIAISGGLEETTPTQAYGFFQNSSGSTAVTFVFSAIAIPTELLNSISVN